MGSNLLRKNAYKIIVIKSSEEKKNTTDKHGLKLKKSQTKTILENNLKLRKNSLHSDGNLNLKKKKALLWQSIKSTILTIFSGHFSQTTEDPPLLETILNPGSHSHELPENNNKNSFNLYKNVLFCFVFHRIL